MKGIYKSEEGGRQVRERYQQFLKYWPVPSQQMRLETRQGETFVVACGPAEAPPLFICHGSGGNAVMWMSDVAAWSEHFRVYAVDMIGEPGLSAPSRPPLASDAYALWLDDVLDALSIDRASFVGVSLGGWLALDYATRRPERVNALAVLCPAGIGGQRLGTLLMLAPLRLLGDWGMRKASEMVLGKRPTNPSPAVQAFMGFFALIHRNFRPRVTRIPRFSDADLARLTMPVLAIVGVKDVLLDSAATKRRLERSVPHADVRYLPEAGHFLPGQTMAILEFLRANAANTITSAEVSAASALPINASG